MLSSYFLQKSPRYSLIWSGKKILKTGIGNIIRHTDYFKELKMDNTTQPDESARIEQCKAAAAKLAVDENITSNCIIGIGSGSTIRYVVERIGHVIKEKGISVKCIPTSFQSKQLIYEYNLPITELDCHPVIDVTIDGADEVDGNLVAIKGGGACLAQEKIVAFASKKFVVVADYRKDSKYLGENWTKGIPIEVLPMASNAIRHHVCGKFKINLHDIEVRMGREKAGPVITDNGNQVLDWKFKTDSTKKLASHELERHGRHAKTRTGCRGNWDIREHDSSSVLRSTGWHSQH